MLSRGGRYGLPDTNSSYGSCGRKVTLNLKAWLFRTPLYRKQKRSEGSADAVNSSTSGSELESRKPASAKNIYINKNKRIYGS